MKKIDNFSKNGSQLYTSIINFSDTARIIYDRVKPGQINVHNIPFSGRGTDFEAAFREAYNVANRYIRQETVIFIFMTDGGATYPQTSIRLLEGLMTNYPKKFTYSGI